MVPLSLALAACTDALRRPGPASDRLTPVEQAVRVSTAIRGIRPTPDELRWVDADPNALGALVDAWLRSPGFGETIRDLHAEQLRIRTDVDEQLPLDGPLAGFDTATVHRGLAEAPLKLIEDVVTSGRPYTEIVTTDTLQVSAVYAIVHGLPFDPDGPDWQTAQWDDGRPRAGILSDSELWRRHRSAGSNFHRGRANLVASTLLCEDFATRDVPVEGGIDLSDELAVAEAVSTQTTCVACHQALDPLAAFFWGFRHQLNAQAVRNSYEAGCAYPIDDPDPLPGHGIPTDLCYPLRTYQPELEDDWAVWGLRPPGYYGLPGRDLVDLGRYLAEDDRFATCTAKRFWSWFAEVPVSDVDDAWAATLRDALVDADWDARGLVKAIVTSDRFLSRDGVGPLTTRPEQLARTIEDLTGFRWTVDPDRGACTTECWRDVDLTVSDRYGFRAMAGGIDGVSVTRPTRSPTPVRRLVLERLAGEAASAVVETDFALPAADRRLLGGVELDTDDDPTLRAALVELHARIGGELVTPNGPVVDRTLRLLRDADALTGDRRRSWKIVLTAMLQDSHLEFE
ncbi:MAG: DUF1585 domain-containing protein [Myxococcota bacterium]